VSAPDAEFERLLEFVRDTRGFDYTGYRRPTLMRRFAKRLQTVGADDWEAYRSYLEAHPEEFSELFNAILINVTGFFRDRETWEVVASDVIPRLLEARGVADPIRVWSAGCASGEEPYTVLMLLAEALGEDALKERVKIYATDVDDEALAEARDATYAAKHLEDVPAELRERYFQPANGGVCFRKDLRRLVIFGRNDLHRDPPISRVDLLVSRNTLMYFGPDVQERILANFYFSLTRGGFLVVGKAEALQSGRRLFSAYDLKRRIFVKDGAVVPPFLRAPRLLPRELPGAEDVGELRDAAFEHAPMAQIVVGEDSTVAAVNQPARTLFGLKLKDVGRPLQDLDISYRPVDLRSLIDAVREKRRLLSAKDVRWESPTGDERWLDVQVSPLIAPPERVVGVSIAFIDVTLHRTLEDHLDSARRDLETAYEELQSTVEELETTNEELQSTNEELETTNEELQSTNEELETMNEELQSTNEELETMNDELRERTDETMRANAFLGSVLSGIRQAVIVVDRELHVIAWNRLATEHWGLRDDEVEGQHLLNLDIGLPLDGLRDPIRVVLGGVEPDDLTLDGHNRRGQRVAYRVSFAPLQGELEGGVVGAILLVTATPA
jgi:two-component system CheB/CheR fusion protein